MKKNMKIAYCTDERLAYINVYYQDAIFEYIDLYINSENIEIIFEHDIIDDHENFYIRLITYILNYSNLYIQVENMTSLDEYLEKIICDYRYEIINSSYLLNKKNIAKLEKSYIKEHIKIFERLTANNYYVYLLNLSIEEYINYFNIKDAQKNIIELSICDYYKKIHEIPNDGKKIRVLLKLNKINIALYEKSILVARYIQSHYKNIEIKILYKNIHGIEYKYLNKFFDDNKIGGNRNT